MYLGFLTVCLGNMPLKEKAKWASENGFKSLEVACWPKLNNRDYSSSDLDVDGLTPEKAEEIKEYFKEYGLKISSLAYYDNNLSSDPEKRKFINNHTKKCIDAAKLLGVDMVGTFIGRNEKKNLKENFDEFEKVFGDLVSYGESKNVKIIIENCPMEGWQVEGLPGTISFTPELFDEMFRRIPSKYFGLNYDPSHLVWQFIDYIDVIPKYIDRIFHVHAKDTEIFEDNFKKYGVFNKQLRTTPGTGYWRYRMPGLGQINWGKFVKTLKENGYDGVISTEHEDPVYEGSVDKVKEGLILGRKHLEQFI
ncbi:MAG: sugar phosphate isomerase/epimerase [Clostridiales bacterium]|nr:sugar phosphate isomerase/epimerase [Clostridiales bacterium]HBM80253.1 sugar phosphate isomerase [Clostridiaceae bacterium]